MYIYNIYKIYNSVNYINYVVHYIPSTYLPYNGKFDYFHPLLPFPTSCL